MLAVCMSSVVRFLQKGLEGSPICVFYANGWFDFIWEKRDQGPEGPEKLERSEKPEKPERPKRPEGPKTPKRPGRPQRP